MKIRTAFKFSGGRVSAFTPINKTDRPRVMLCLESEGCDLTVDQFMSPEKARAMASALITAANASEELDAAEVDR